MSIDRTTAAVREFRAAFNGQVITPDDPRYGQARTVYSGAVDRRPAVIVRPNDAAEAAKVVTVARESGLALAVRSGGHSNAGHSVCDGGIVLDLNAMKAVAIDVEARTAWAETGLTAGEYTTAAGAHGLVTGFGDAGTVGIGGITLGGGIGFLVRKHGLTIDDVLAAELVTADGEILHVDSAHHPELFWALRGGGGNFGVVTRFKYRLHELSSIVGGMLVLPATAENVHAFVAESEAAPEELSTIANVMPSPPVPFVPAEHHGRMVIWAMMCWAGPTEQGQEVLGRFRALGPIADLLQEMPYSGMYPPGPDGLHPVAESTNLFIDTADAGTVDTILRHLRSSTAVMPAAQLRVLGGAMARVPNDATAFWHRQSKIMVNLAAIYEDPAQSATHAAWIRDFAAAIRQTDHGAYVNFLNDEGQERVRAAYPAETYARLAAVKAAYDPDNFFRLNQNIPPAV